MRVFSIVTALVLATLGAGGSLAQVPDLPQTGNVILPGGGQVTAQIVQYVILITVLSVAPGLVVMLTSFTRIIIALSFLRNGIGLQTTPSTILLVTLAMFLTFFIMAPTFDNAWKNGWCGLSWMAKLRNRKPMIAQLRRFANS